MTRKPARISNIWFTYSDPGVDVSTEQRTVEHETIDNQTVVQVIGRKPDQVTVNADVPSRELPLIDKLTTAGVIELRTERWSGDVIVKSTSTNFQRAKNHEGQWLYEATIECLEVDELSGLEELIDEGVIDPGDVPGGLPGDIPGNSGI